MDMTWGIPPFSETCSACWESLTFFCKNTLEVATATTRFIHKPEPITANHKHVQETKWKNPSLQKIENKTPSSTSKRNAKDQIQCHSCKFILPNCHRIIVEVGLVKVTTWRSTYPFFVAWEMSYFSWSCFPETFTKCLELAGSVEVVVTWSIKGNR